MHGKWPFFVILMSTMFVPFEAEHGMGRECVCERKLKPVCSNEGRTYDNICLFDCSKRLRPALSIQYSGSCCPSASLCPQHYAPICDNYGSIHDNQCHFEYQKCLARKMYGVMLRPNGVCENSTESAIPEEKGEQLGEVCDFECPIEADPLCDDRGVTHKNQCYFEKLLCTLHAKKMPLVTIIFKGTCDNKTSRSTKIPQPIFGAVIHELAAEPLAEASQHPTEDPSKFFQHQPDPFIAENPYDAFVSTFTHAQKQNESMRTSQSTQHVQLSTTTIVSTPLFTTQKQSTTSLYGLIDHESTKPNITAPQNNEDESRFQDGPECSAIDCYKKWDPVCDSRNQTHRNECLFNFRVCKLKKESDTFVLPKILHKGQCNSKSQPQKPQTPLVREGFCQVCNLQEEQQQVCTNNNVTFSNACDLAQWNCEQRARSLEEQILVHVGACRNNSLVFTMQNEVCPATCPRHYKPVCDSDGTTFPNLCTFQMVNCHERKMKKPDPSWLVTLRECPHPDTSIENQQITSTIAPDITSTSTKKSNLTEIVEENSFVCPESCPEQEAENLICDQEGSVYKNECQFTRARCLAAKVGRSLHTIPEDECPANKCRFLNARPCPSDYDPVCATDFRTLQNTCALERAKCQDAELDMLFKGECSQCLKSPCPLLDENDADESEFVCDQNGETKSRCEFEMVRCIYEIRFGHNISAAYEGKCCPSFEVCSSDLKPICDNKRKEHRNLCHFQIAACRAHKIEKSEPLQIFKNESCQLSSTQTPLLSSELVRNVSAKIVEQKSSICNQPLPLCTDVYDPVCGSDHKTYANECQFIVKSCNATVGLKVLYRGACCKDECSEEPNPVCDNEKRTHLNLCKFGHQRCLANRLHQKNLTVVTYSSCLEDSCNLHCPKIYQPVCSKNGKTYVNECEVRKLNCFMQKNNVTARLIEIDYPHECCPHIDCASNGFDPVCDSDKKVHTNQCEFENQQCVQVKRTGVKLHQLDKRECFEVIKERFTLSAILATKFRL